MRIAQDKIKTLKHSILSILPNSEIFFLAIEQTIIKKGGDIDPKYR